MSFVRSPSLNLKWMTYFFGSLFFFLILNESILNFVKYYLDLAPRRNLRILILQSSFLKYFFFQVKNFCLRCFLMTFYFHVFCQSHPFNNYLIMTSTSFFNFFTLHLLIVNFKFNFYLMQICSVNYFKQNFY